MNSCVGLNCAKFLAMKTPLSPTQRLPLSHNGLPLVYGFGLRQETTYKIEEIGSCWCFHSIDIMNLVVLLQS